MPALMLTLLIWVMSDLLPTLPICIIPALRPTLPMWGLPTTYEHSVVFRCHLGDQISIEDLPFEGPISRPCIVRVRYVSECFATRIFLDGQIEPVDLIGSISRLRLTLLELVCEK